MASVSNKFTSLNSDEILYGYYSYDSLQYTIDLFKGFYEIYKKDGQGKDPLFDKKCSILKFEIVAKFCHYAEILGSFLYPCHSTELSLNSIDILENLSKYKVMEIEKFYQDFKSGYVLDTSNYNNFKHLFGYNRINEGQRADQLIRNSITNIIDVLRIIGEFYIFWKDSYNAYKHGYRLWFGDEHQHKLNVVVYLNKYNKLNRQNNIDYLPIDDKTIDDIHNMSKYCRNVFDVIFDNRRALLEAKNTALNSVEFDFLKFKEPTITISKMKFNI